MRLLIVSNLDSAKPFGQFTRPFYLGRGLARQGWEVANVGVDCARVDFGPAWSTHDQSLRRLAGATRHAVRAFGPDLVYAHQNLPGIAALLATRGVPVVADYHALPSLEWKVLADAAPAGERRGLRLAQHKADAAERTLARFAHGSVAAGAGLAEDIVARLDPARRPAVVPNGIPDELLRAPRTPSPYGSPNGVRHAVATLPKAASAANEHSFALLVEMAHELDRQDARVVVHVLGSDDGPRAPGVVYHGVQDSLVPWIEHADVCLLPAPAEAALAGGARNKLLEYLGRGRCIVSTREGLRAMEGVAEWPGVHVTGDAPAELARAVADAVRNGGPGLAANRADIGRLSWDQLSIGLGQALQAAHAGAR